MKTSIIIFLIGIFVFLASCKKQSVGETESSTQIYVNLDSLEREGISEAMGDTAFGGVCYGMNLEQTKKAIADFKASLGFDATDYSFYFCHYSFFLSNPHNIEGLSEYDLDVSHINALLYRDKLFEIRWESKKNYAKNGEDVINQLNPLISTFETKFGKCSFKDLQPCYYIGRKVINGRLFPVIATVATWKTKDKSIIITIKEPIGSDRGHESPDYPLRYNVTISFFHNFLQEEANTYIDSIKSIQKKIEQERILNQTKKEINAL